MCPSANERLTASSREGEDEREGGRERDEKKSSGVGAS